MSVESLGQYRASPQCRLFGSWTPPRSRFPPTARHEPPWLESGRFAKRIAYRFGPEVVMMGGRETAMIGGVESKCATRSLGRCGRDCVGTRAASPETHCGTSG